MEPEARQGGTRQRLRCRPLLACALALITTTAGVPAAIAASAPAQQRANAHKVFYLDALKHHCYIATSASSEHFTAVGCSNPQHDLEVYWTGHGGWGNSNPSQATKSADARATCISRYEHVDHGSYKPYSFFFADPGRQHRKYHDHTVCAHSTRPNLEPLGAGWHVKG